MWGGSPGPPARDTSRGHLPAEGRRGEGRRSPPGAPRSGPPRLREHAAGQARADVIGSAPRAPGRAGEGGHRAGRERDASGDGRGCLRAGGPAETGGPLGNPPRNFSQTRSEGLRDRAAVTASPRTRPRPAPSTLSALPRSKVRAPPCPLGSGSRPRCPDFQSVRDQRPGANFSSPRQRKPSPLGLLLRLPPSAGRPRSYVR